MNHEFLNYISNNQTIAVGILTASVSIITLFISQIFNLISNHQKFEHETEMKLLDTKIKVYQNLYSGLLCYRSYFMLFIDGGNEYKENRDSSEFAPLEANQKFRSEFERNYLFLSKDLIILCNEALENGELLNTLGLNMASGNYPDLINSVEPSCNNVINNIEKCINQIKLELKV